MPERRLRRLSIGLVLSASSVLAGGAVAYAAEAPVLPPEDATAALRAESVPPVDTAGWPASPSTVAGERRWRPPSVTHWPAVLYEGERRHVAVDFPITQDGTAVLGWADSASPPAEVAVPASLVGKRHSGLLWLPSGTGTHAVHLELPGQAGSQSLPVHVVDVAGDWPHSHLRDGRPVDADGDPVVVRMPRWQPERLRKWSLFREQQPLPTGEPILLGDPLPARGADAWQDVPARRLEAADPHFPHHAVLPALAGLQPPYPRVLVWSPGNGGLQDHVWNGDDERILSLIRARFAAVGAAPRLVLLLPPLPVREDLQPVAQRRRELLQRTAQFLGWDVLDAARLAGDPETANAIAPGVHASYPVGEAQAAISQALSAICRDAD